MATVTGLTAERMLEIEAESIVDGAVNGAGHLILTRHDGTTIDAGPVVGPEGPTGPMGATSIAVVTSATHPATPFEGLFIYETDTDRFYSWNGTAWIERGLGKIICTSATRPATPYNGMEIWETDTKLHYIYDGTAWMSQNQVRRARVTNSAPIPIPNNVETVLTFDTERTDVGGLHAPATPTRLIAQLSGFYAITGNAQFQGNANGRRKLSIKLNAGLQDIGRSGTIYPTDANVVEAVAFAHWEMNAGDYVQLYAFQDSGGALNINQTADYSPEFSMVRLSV